MDTLAGDWVRKGSHRNGTKKSHLKNPPPRIAQTGRSEVLKAVTFATETIGQCPNRLWAVTRNLPGGLSNILRLFPSHEGFETFPRTRNRHHQCSFEFCEHSVLNFTSVIQRHECGPRRAYCHPLTEHFPGEPLEEAAEKEACMAWNLNGRVLMTAPHGYMAISHVWSDGTGSGISSEKGVNRCLWFLFMQIAKSLHVNGIWWDAICLPKGKAARIRAINQMHQNYEDARITLVHDCFIREFEWDDDNPRKSAEMASLAIVMSPWFSRGWTALELAVSVSVKILFKKGHGFVVKDLDNDIMSISTGQSSIYQTATQAIKGLRAREVSSLDRLLTVLGPRYTSWSRDMAIIAGILTGVNIRDDDTQSGIYQRVLKRVGWICHKHLYYNSPKMTKGFDWCPVNILGIPLASQTPRLRVQENGNLSGPWRAFQLHSIPPASFGWTGVPPLTELALRSALDRPRQHVFLVEPDSTRAEGALLVEVVGRHEDRKTMYCNVVGYLAFHSVQNLHHVAKVDLVACLGQSGEQHGDVKDAWSVAGLCQKVRQGGLQDQRDKPAKLPLTPTHHRQDLEMPYAITNLDPSAKQASHNIDLRDDYGRTALHCAVWRDHEQAVKDLLLHKANPNIEDDSGDLPIHLSAERGNTRILKLLVSSGAKVRAVSRSDGQTAFHRAVYSGSLSVVKCLMPISRIHARDESGRTALHISTSLSLFAVSESLCRWGLDVNIKDKLGRFALWWAARNGDEQTIRLLLQQNKIRVNATDKWGRTALHLAARQGHLRIVRLLLKHRRVNPMVLDYFGRSAPFHAVLYEHVEIARAFPKRSATFCQQHQTYPSQKSRKTVQTSFWPAIDLLLKNKSARWKVSKFDQRDYREGPGHEDLVIWAAAMGFSEVVEYLMEAGMYPDSKTGVDQCKYSALQKAAYNGDEDSLRLLLESREVNINYQANLNRTPLCNAVESGNPSAVKILLESEDIDLSIRDLNGNTALDVAADLGHPVIVTILLATGKFNVNDRPSRATSMTALACAAEKGNVEVMKILLSTPGIEVDLTAYGHTPLQFAAQEGHTEAVMLLLRTDKVNVNFTGVVNKTPLMLAARNGHSSVVEILLESGNADINARDMVNATALSLAVQGRHERVVPLLLHHLTKTNSRTTVESLRAAFFECARYGLTIVGELLKLDDSLDINARNEDMKTPLIIAAMFGKIEFIRELLTCGKTVHINAQDKYTRTALSYAAERGNEEIVTELMALGDELDLNLEDVTGCTPLLWATIYGHVKVAKLLSSTGRAKFGSMQPALRFHAFDPLLQFIDSIKLIHHYKLDASGPAQPGLTRKDLDLVSTNVLVPLKALMEEILKPGGPQTFTGPTPRDDTMFNTLLEHLDKKQTDEHRFHEESKAQSLTREGLKDLSSLVDFAPHLLVPEAELALDQGDKLGRELLDATLSSHLNGSLSSALGAAESVRRLKRRSSSAYPSSEGSQ